jgi:ubiquinone biosynthesis protein
MVRSREPEGARSLVYVPRVFDEYSTRSILVMESITGTLMSDFITVRNSDPIRLEKWLTENEISATKVGRRLLFAFLQELLEDNLSHGDLHPGNIILLRNSRFAFIDLGSIGSLEKAGLDHYLQSFRAMAIRDYDKAADMLFLLSPRLPPSIDLAEVKQQLLKAYQAWDARAHLKSLPYHEKSVNSLGNDTGNILLAHKIAVSWAFLKVGRTGGHSMLRSAI